MSRGEAFDIFHQNYTIALGRLSSDTLATSESHPSPSCLTACKVDLRGPCHPCPLVSSWIWSMGNPIWHLKKVESELEISPLTVLPIAFLLQKRRCSSLEGQGVSGSNSGFLTVPTPSCLKPRGRAHVSRISLCFSHTFVNSPYIFQFEYHPIPEKNLMM